MLLKGRTALVTGASSGIGRSIALEFGREGANVIVVDIQKSPKQGKYHEQDVVTPTKEEIEKLGADAIFLKADVAHEEAIQEVIEAGVDRFGHLDILVNNAGIHIPATIEDMSIESWDRVVNVNFRAAFTAIRSAVPYLKKSKNGRIIQIASINAYGGGLGPAYPASKAAVTNLIRDAAVELGKYGVTANVIWPGYIETAIQDYLTPKDISSYKEAIPLSRLGKPQDIGRSAVFLASDDAQWITGTTLVVDGGHLAKT